MIPRVEASLACMAQSATGPCRAAGPALSALPGRGSDRRATGLQARVTHLEQRHAAHRELVEGAVVAYPSPSRRLRFEVLGAGSPSNADTPGIKTEPALNITRLSSTCSSACCALRLAMATIRCVRALCACAGVRCPNLLPPPNGSGSAGSSRSSCSWPRSGARARAAASSGPTSPHPSARPCCKPRERLLASTFVSGGSCKGDMKSPRSSRFMRVRLLRKMPSKSASLGGRWTSPLDPRVLWVCSGTHRAKHHTMNGHGALRTALSQATKCEQGCSSPCMPIHMRSQSSETVRS